MLFVLIISPLAVLAAAGIWYYCCLRMIPELEHYTGWYRRLQVLLRARYDAFDNGKLRWIVTVLPSLLFLPPIIFKAPIPMVALVFIMTLAGLAIPDYLLLERIRRQLRIQLLRRGVRICLNCGYDLHRNESGYCPECGQPPDNFHVAFSPDQ